MLGYCPHWCLFLIFMSVSVLAGGVRYCPACPGGTGFHAAGMRLLPCRRGSSRWSAGGGKGAQPVPAGDESVFPGPVRADLQGPLPGVADEAGGDVPDPVASLNNQHGLEGLDVVAGQETARTLKATSGWCLQAAARRRQVSRSAPYVRFLWRRGRGHGHCGVSIATFRSKS